MDTPNTADEVLAMLKDFFSYEQTEQAKANRPYVERKKLWDVLTALRGPDTPSILSDNLKFSTTSIIRSKAFGDSAIQGFAILNPKDSDFNVEQRKKLEVSHFYFHAVAAFEALGLKWYENNGDVAN